ncbi:Transposase [Sporobacter termitidis DSM 10068]|uniref:Transposase n=1 Tax=Sporobacter termitidis DSM 10068 TaxID=1123282 RepID=A0A1M5ZJM4_9FIRM|nr:transposase [Sporobacter termitidis]SHI24348.1 Transposase [Sporobacter termitidis DSM 10068]
MAKGKYQKWLEPDGLLKLTAWARDGLTDEQLAKNMGISSGTLYEWKKQFSEISEALKRGKEVADIEVENALYKRAIGYSYTETTRERIMITDPETGETRPEMCVTKEVIKGVQPDTTAQIFWLKNRKPEQWRDKPDNSATNPVENDGFIEALDGKVDEAWQPDE